MSYGANYIYKFSNLAAGGFSMLKGGGWDRIRMTRTRVCEILNKRKQVGINRRPGPYLKTK